MQTGTQFESDELIINPQVTVVRKSIGNWPTVIGILSGVQSRQDYQQSTVAYATVLDDYEQKGYKQAVLIVDLSKVTRMDDLDSALSVAMKVYTHPLVRDGIVVVVAPKSLKTRFIGLLLQVSTKRSTRVDDMEAAEQYVLKAE